MLSNKNRFVGRGSLTYAYRNGIAIRSNYSVLKFTPTNKHSEYRVAVVVSKKVAKSAPVRNRIRRRVYESIRLLAPKYLKNQDIIITVFDDRYANISHQELMESISQQLEQVKAHS